MRKFRYIGGGHGNDSLTSVERFKLVRDFGISLEGFHVIVPLTKEEWEDLLKKDKCEFYPTEAELYRDGPFCHCSSEISGDFICTREYSETCQWANEQRAKNKEVQNDSGN